ncbi:MAG: hypothetical protein ACI9MC_002667, partial [Kiritimatiellia bacterium]
MRHRRGRPGRPLGTLEVCSARGLSTPSSAGGVADGEVVFIKEIALMRSTRLKAREFAR